MRRKKDALIPIETAVLEAALSLRAVGTEAIHGFQVAKIIQDQTGARQLTAHGTLYRALHRLEQAGFMESTWEDPRIGLEQGRPPRRFYWVTAAGEQALAKAAEENAASRPNLNPRRATP